MGVPTISPLRNGERMFQTTGFALFLAKLSNKPMYIADFLGPGVDGARVFILMQ
jgi:hypothetical protein